MHEVPLSGIKIDSTPDRLNSSRVCTCIGLDYFLVNVQKSARSIIDLLNQRHFPDFSK